MQGFSPSQAAAKTGCNPRTVASWSHRYGWKKAAAQSAVILQETKTPALAAIVAKTSGVVRQTLAEEISVQANRLRTTNPGKGIVNAKHRAEVTKTLVDASNKLFGWDQQSATQLVQVETLLDLEHRPTVTVPGSNATQPAIIESSADHLPLPESSEAQPQSAPTDSDPAI